MRKKIKLKLQSRRLAVICHDLLMVVAAWGLAFFTRYNFSLPDSAWAMVWQTLVVVTIAQAIVFWVTGLYKGLWRFASLPDMWNISRAAIIGVLAISLCLFLFNRMEGIPRTILLFYPVFLVFLLGVPRIAYRMWKEHGFNLKNAAGRKHVLIVGAGRSGEMLVRDLLREREYLVVGFLDDNHRLKGAKVRGIPVLGSIHDIPDVVDVYQVNIIMIAIPSASSKQMRRIVEQCEQTEVPFRTLPGMQDLVSGQSTLNELREVAIDDLLGRDPVQLDWAGINQGISGKTILISGGGGSIGSELCRQIAKLGPAKLILFEKSEFNLYSIGCELKNDYPNLIFHSVLGDVCDAASVAHVLKSHAPEIIFHAAAYKHVPMLEYQVREAVRNNVLGTRLMAQTAAKFACETFVMISTDKAVNPANVMGASKRASEIFCQALNSRVDTHYITVRFGNVLGSAGSVVPLFKEQIARGGPVTVTHPDITRFFMTIPEASQLILQAACMGKGGEIFVLDMGEPLKISYLAEQMIRLSGKIPGDDIEIKYTGLRPGEKLFEELFYQQEDLLKTGHKKILLARSTQSEWDEIESNMAILQKASDDFDEGLIQETLHQLVPELSEQQAISLSNDSNVVEFNRA
ncbi:MAG: polysaccharide biosynthesis protein [Thiotrichaceae bacterium]|nr:polysaccharide biosynthesis protein [Thiotrichaceae bacterium]PCI13972.1 MAG: polysaccharide biosynthesis protein [Thiotrichales bacterium]